MSAESPEPTPVAEGKGEGRRARHHERLLAMVARSPFRSPLFWWLFEHHDELAVEAAGSRVGLPWSRLCSGFAEAGLTAVDGTAVKPETARKTWQRVRKEKARLRRLEAEAEAERALRLRAGSATQHAVADVGPVRSAARRGSASASGQSATTATRLQPPGDRPGRGGGPSRRSVDDRDVPGGAPGPEHLRAARRAGALGEAGAERGGATAHQGDDADIALRALEEGSNSGPEQSCGSRKETVKCPSKRSTMTASRS